MISFITTLYNEEKEVADLINHVYDYVDLLVIVNDGSTDKTESIIQTFPWDEKIEYVPIEHVGVCELGRIEALRHVPDDSWVIMLDADERFAEGVLDKIYDLLINHDPWDTTFSHIYFDQEEYIDGNHVRTYQKPKVFKKSAIMLPEIIHGDPTFLGNPISYRWKVIHRKTSNKQIQREIEYLQVYEKLLAEGKIDEDKANWFRSFHHYVRELHG